jgi:dipeptidyl-peptidase 4
MRSSPEGERNASERRCGRRRDRICAHFTASSRTIRRRNGQIAGQSSAVASLVIMTASISVGSDRLPRGSGGGKCKGEPVSAEMSFPRQYARTQRFSLGTPRSFTISPEGGRIAFLRSRSGTDRATCLWVRDVAGGAEQLVADPVALLAGGAENLPPAERARRERLREGAGGVVAYATDRAMTVAAFALSGRLFVADLTGSAAGSGGDGAGEVRGAVRELPVPGPVVDPRPDPTGTHVAYVVAGALRVVATDGGGDRPLAEPESGDISYGLAEFVAAEEMVRTRGFWWSPDGRQLLVARVDTGPVARWYLSDPAHPDRPATEVAYPAAGTANADVSVLLVGLDGTRRPVARAGGGAGADATPYLVAVHWSSGGPALLHVQSRDQRTTSILAVADDGGTSVVAGDSDPVWVALVPGTPAWTPDGRLVRVVAREDAYRLMVGEELVTAAPIQVRAVCDVDGDILFTASAEDPTQVHVYTAGPKGVVRLTDEPGVHGASGAGDITVTVSASLAWTGSLVRLWRGSEQVGTVASYAETPVLTPDVTMLTVGLHALRCALLLPRGHRRGSRPLPVLLDPYGGPAAQRVLSARGAYLSSQWFADQGFAVLVTDGRGTPGRGPAWDRSIHLDQATPNIDDQVEALRAVAATHPDLDLAHVGIRGWSHGGYLAALAVLRRPDVFHAAVAGAPVVDWQLYDTHYTERYLGHPGERPEVYARNSLLADAPALTRPLMLIHGLADDNVVAAHTLRLSSALLAAGRPHTVLPLSGVTHMTPQEEVAENLLLLQVDFLKRSLGVV